MLTSFDSLDAANLLETGILRVNKLARLCRLGPRRNSRSTTPAGGRGKNRHYSVEELCQVALAYWLFRAGLRGPFIASILADKAVDRFIAPLSSFKRIRAEAVRRRFLIVSGFKTMRKAKAWTVKHERAAFVGNLRKMLTIVGNRSCVIVPVGRLLQELADKILG